MIVLAIDTAGVDCSAAIYDGASGKSLAAVTDMIGKGHAERLMAVIDEALLEAGRSLDDIDRIVVVIGPGSFTGIRVGVAAARGLALALGIEAVGVTTLEVLASGYLDEHPGTPVVAAIDAKRNEIYAQAFSVEGQPVGQPAALSPDDALELSRSLGAAVAGSGRAVMQGAESGSGGGDRFDIVTIARIGALKPTADRPAPLYLRGPDAKIQTGYALART